MLSFSDPAALNDPYPQFKTLRDQGAVLWDEGRQAWLVSGYAEVREALKSPRLSVRTAGARMGKAGPEFQPVVQLVGNFLTRLDPPDHTRLRQLVLRAFTPRTVTLLQEAILQRIQNLLEAAADEFDFVSEFAVPLPVGVICDLLGVPPESQASVKQWSDALGGIADLDPEPTRLHAALDACEQFQTFVDERIAHCRQNPCEALLSRLVEVEEAGDRLSREELFGLCQVLLIAGQETTTCLLANGMDLLLKEPALVERLRHAPDLVPSFVEECLRWQSPVQVRTRCVLEPLELGGQSLRPGDNLLLLIGAANRDGEVFEKPDAFLLERKPNHHLAFGEGPHFCLGAALARLEASLAFRALLSYPLHLAGQPHRGANFSLRGFDHLPVRRSN